MTKIWNTPRISSLIPDPDPSGDDVIGGGTGQSTTDPYPCSFADWQIMFAEDYDLDEDIDFDDYGQWWADNGFSEDDWAELNPGVDFIWE